MVVAVGKIYIRALLHCMGITMGMELPAVLVASMEIHWILRLLYILEAIQMALHAGWSMPIECTDRLELLP